MTDMSVIESIFLRVVEKQSPEERSAFLDDQCPDVETRREVERLLAAHPRVGSFLQEPAAEFNVTLEGTSSMGKPGTRIGSYKLMEKIGEGGFGLVFVAEQQQPVRRRVAIKVIKPGMDAADVIARFEAERQALALMDHPNIARVLDAGTTDSGRPYFVMELVKGISIVEYCNQQRLNTTDRLKLFVSVCHAVQHAHGKGVIHRDLKPSNILVSSYDGSPVVKVIDFGVAKAIGQQLTDKTVYTRFAQLIGTPLYMSPEQAEINALDVDTRSDVYSLGVLLYELLTGTTPFDPARLKDAAFDEMRRIIREEEPPKPSTRLSSLGKTTTRLSASYSGEPNRLSRSMRGDLDWVVMKALEKDRRRRYETASAFADDVRRFLDDEAVVARPPSTAYRFRKFARRNKAALTTLAALSSILVLASIFSLWSAKIAYVERAKTQVAAERAARSEYGANLNLISADWKAGNIGRVWRTLQLTENFPSRAFEWYYWQRQLHRELHTFKGHTGWIRDVAFSPDGKLVVSVSDDGTAKVWDLRTRTLQETLLHDAPVRMLEFSQDGRQILTACNDGVARVWHFDKGTLELELPTGHRRGISSARFLANQRIITAGWDGKISVWDAETKKNLRRWEAGHDTIYALAVSPDEQWAVSCDAGTLQARFWNIDSAAPGVVLEHPAGSRVTEVAFGPNGKRIVSGMWTGHAFVWDVNDGTKPQMELRGNSGAIRSIEFSKDGKWIAVANTQGVARIFDATSGEEHCSFKGHGSGVWTASLSSNGQMIATGGHVDQTLKVWQKSDLHGPDTLEVARGDSLVANLPGSNCIVTAGNADNSARIVDLATNQVRSRLNGHGIAINPVEGTAQVVNDASHFRRTGRITAIATSADGKWIVTAGVDGTLIAWDTNGRKKRELKGHSAAINAVAITKDGKWCVTGGHDQKVTLWNLLTGEGREFNGHKSAVYSVAIEPNGGWLVSGSYDGEVIKSNVATGEVDERWNPGGSRIMGLAVSPAGDRIAAISWGTKGYLWDVQTGDLLHELRGHTRVATEIAFSPDGSRILTGGWDGRAILWDAANGRELVTLETPMQKKVTAVAFSDDGLQIATGCSEPAKRVFLWKAASNTDVERWNSAKH